jgi:hypothetical protein
MMITADQRRLVIDNVVRIIERYNRSLLLARIEPPRPLLDQRHPLVTYCLSVTSMTLLFFLLSHQQNVSLVDQWQKLAWCLFWALILAWPTRDWRFGHKDTPQHIHDEPEEAAVCAAAYPDSQPISLAPLAGGQDDAAAFIERVHVENKHLYRFTDDSQFSLRDGKLTYNFVKDLSIAVIARLQADSVLARHQSV